VATDRVAHCLSCGRCFCFRPGFTRPCAHCGGPPRGRAARVREESEEEQREDLQLEMQFAAEGYWGM
jgi:hypothetical protein